MTDAEEKQFRKAPRARAQVRVKLSAEALSEAVGELWATTRDIGWGGAFLRTDRVLDAGTRLTLQVEVGGAPLVVEAEVKWCSPPGSKEPGMGVSYVDPPAEVRQRLVEIAERGELPIFELYED